MEMQDDVIVYIQSHENEKEYPQNNASSYFNILKPGLHLREDCEVGLKNVIFEEKYDAIHAISSRFCIHLVLECIVSWNTVPFIRLRFDYIPTKNIACSDLKNCIEELDIDFRQSLVTKNFIDKKHPPIIKFNASQQIVTITEISTPQDLTYSYKTRWRFSNEFCDLLGVDTATNGSYNSICNRPGRMIKPSILYIYSNIVHASKIGHQNVNILDIIPVGSNVYTKNITSPVYKPVSSTTIDNVTITILDEHSDIAPFSKDVNITLILHFRPKS